MKIAVSFYTTEFTKLKKFWNKNSSVNRKGFRGSKVAKDFSQGGLYSLYCFDKKKELETVDLITPGGFDYDSDYLYVGQYIFVSGINNFVSTPKLS